MLLLGCFMFIVGFTVVGWVAAAVAWATFHTEADCKGARTAFCVMSFFLALEVFVLFVAWIGARAMSAES